MSRVIDCMTYNGERDILRIHLSILGGLVDTFVICEAKTTFSGHKKPLYFSRDQKYFKPWWHQIRYHVIDEDYTQSEIDQANSSPNTQGAIHWKREFLQKESIKKALIQAKAHDDDTIFIGDVDEIWEPLKVSSPTKLKLRVYTYYLNNRSNEIFWGTLATKYGDIKDECLNHMRSDKLLRGSEYQGWHFTWMGGVNEARRKLNDSYSNESYNLPIVQANLESAVLNSIDILNRPFTYTKDESEWPAFLTKNRAKYQHMLI